MTAILDKLDRKIIVELEKDGRKSNNKLAEYLHTSKATIARRIKSMISSGLISILAKPDPLRLGWFENALILVKADLKHIDMACDELAEYLYTNYIATLLSPYNIGIILGCPHCSELYAFIDKIKEIDGVKNVKIYFIKKYNKRYFYGNDAFHYDRINEIKSVDITPEDMEIIKKLNIDGRITIKQLAEDLERPQSAVRRRMLWLLKQEVIKIGAVVNSSFLGYRAEAFIILQVNGSHIEENIRKLVQNPNIVTVAEFVNDADIGFLIHAPTAEMLQEKLRMQMNQLAGEEIIQVLMRAELKKRYYGQCILDEERLLS